MNEVPQVRSPTDQHTLPVVTSLKPMPTCTPVLFPPLLASVLCAARWPLHNVRTILINIQFTLLPLTPQMTRAASILCWKCLKKCRIWAGWQHWHATAGLLFLERVCGPQLLQSPRAAGVGMALCNLLEQSCTSNSTGSTHEESRRQAVFIFIPTRYQKHYVPLGLDKSSCNASLDLAAVMLC